MPWFVKIETGIVPKAEFDRHIAAHKAYVQDSIDRGHQTKTGYWRERGGGMMLFQAESLAEAQQLIEADPLVQNHCVSYQYTNGALFWVINPKICAIMEFDLDPRGRNA